MIDENPVRMGQLFRDVLGVLTHENMVDGRFPCRFQGAFRIEVARPISYFDSQSHDGNPVSTEGKPNGGTTPFKKRLRESRLDSEARDSTSRSR